VVAPVVRGKYQNDYIVLNIQKDQSTTTKVIAQRPFISQTDEKDRTLNVIKKEKN
jgi:hypothetical protein